LRGTRSLSRGEESVDGGEEGEVDARRENGREKVEASGTDVDDDITDLERWESVSGNKGRRLRETRRTT
jgi:hypothetical protein